MSEAPVGAQAFDRYHQSSAPAGVDECEIAAGRNSASISQLDSRGGAVDEEPAVHRFPVEAHLTTLVDTQPSMGSVERCRFRSEKRNPLDGSIAEGEEHRGRRIVPGRRHEEGCVG
ncbi:MAG: hypothetical protein LH654_10615, partial [Thermoleophilia bacterium]|nr:hypothetical protein [Thermoleophilia bacterium]